jgi:hypothetical protein
MLNGTVGPVGRVVVRHSRPGKVHWKWRLKNACRWSYLRGWIGKHLLVPLTTWWGLTVIQSELSIRVRRLNRAGRFRYQEIRSAQSRLDPSAPEYQHLEARLRAVQQTYGVWEDYGTVSYRVVTNAGVAFIVSDWNDNSTDITNFNFHGCGTGTAEESASDTALQAEATTILNPDNTRATGTRSTPASNQFRSVGTLTFDGSAAITEHGLFSTSGTGTGTLWDRSVFSAINVAPGDSIQFTYTVTLQSGG